MKNIIILLFVSISSICFAQNDKPQRDAFKLKLAVDEEQYYKMDIDQSPYFVHEKILQIFPGEDLLIEAEIVSDTIASMKVVKKNLNPEKTISIKFEQVTEDRIPQQMILSVHNPFKRSLNYNAAMYIIGHDDWIDTSIIPVMPNLLGMEMWQDIIITLTLHKWRLE